MNDLKYVIRYFDADGNYIYSVHCSSAILDDLIQNAKVSGFNFKIVAYTTNADSFESSSEV